MTSVDVLKITFTGSTEVGRLLDEAKLAPMKEAFPGARRECAFHRLR